MPDDNRDSIAEHEERLQLAPVTVMATATENNIPYQIPGMHITSYNDLSGHSRDKDYNSE